MPPKTPSKLLEQIEAQQDGQAAPGHEKTAEGLEVPTPERADFFGNLAKLSEPEK